MFAAREIQQKLLPTGPLRVTGLAVTAFCEPAREVAGDYYDFLPITDSMIGLLIADVAGKGLAAGLYMAQLKVIVQSLSRLHHEPREFLMAVNKVVSANLDDKSFITMLYGVIDVERREMTFARAGHCPLIHVPANQPAGMRKARLLTPDGLVVRGTAGAPLRGARIRAGGDHRIAMAFAIAGLASPEGVEIDDPQCAEVSFPGFFEALAACGARVERVA